MYFFQIRLRCLEIDIRIHTSGWRLLYFDILRSWRNELEEVLYMCHCTSLLGLLVEFLGSSNKNAYSGARIDWSYNVLLYTNARKSRLEFLYNRLINLSLILPNGELLNWVQERTNIHMGDSVFIQFNLYFLYILKYT